MRWLLTALSAIALAAGSAGSGRIVFLSGGDLYTVAPDGSGRTRLTSDGRSTVAVFSPDGTRVAFLKSDGGSPRDLYVANADGTGGARLLATHPEAENSGVGIHGITWSPDSTRLVYLLPGQPPIRVVDARDGTPQPLPQAGDPRPFATLEWSPDGAELVYDADGDVWAKPLDGRPARRVVALPGTDRSPTWSPDGGRIAFVHEGDAEAGVYVVSRDGGAPRRVGVTPTGRIGAVRWKPDGTAVVFDGEASSRVSGRFPVSTSGVWLAAADGSAQRLLREHVGFPLPSPDGTELLIRQAYRTIPGGDAVKPGIYVMNADGSCLTLVGDGAALDWQPLPGGSAGGRSECVDLVVRATAPELAGLRGPSYSLVVTNEGTLATANVRLVARLDGPVRILVGRSSRRFCSAAGQVLTCRAERMEPRQTLAIAALARPQAAVPLGVAVSADSDVRDSDPASNEVELRTRIYPCWVAGTDFADHLRGTSAGERICARAGNDVVDALGGNDRVDGGPGRDVLVGGAGDDAILARDRQRDVVDCGPGLDTVVADRNDLVSRSCERVSRG